MHASLGCYKFVRHIETCFTDTEILKKISRCFLKLAKNIGPQFCKCSLKRLNISILTRSTHEHYCKGDLLLPFLYILGFSVFFFIVLNCRVQPKAKSVKPLWPRTFPWIL